MKHLKLYEDFIYDKIIDDQIYYLHLELFNKILLNCDVEESVKNEINLFLEDNDNILNENFFNNFKQFFSKTADKTSELSDKAEIVIKDILKKSNDAFSLIKKIGEEIRIFFKYIISNVKEYIKKNIETIKNKIDDLYKLKKDGIIKDFNTMKEVLEFYRKDFSLKLNNSLNKNLTNFFSKDQEVLAESFILEKNIIFKFVHGITKIPPFSWLEYLAKLGELGSVRMVEKMSYLTTKLGGPSFTLPVICLIIGESFEYVVKSWTMPMIQGVEIIQSSGFDGILKGISNIAILISLFSIIEASIGEKISKEEKIS